MTEQSRMFLGIALCVLFYFSYTKYLQNKYPDLNKSKSSIVEQVDSNDSNNQDLLSKSSSSSKSDSQDKTSLAQANQGSLSSGSWTRLSKEQLTIKTNDAVYIFDQEKMGLSSIRLLKYQEKDHDKNLIDRELVDSALVFQGALASANSWELLRGFNAKRINDLEIEFWRDIENSWILRQRVKFNESGYKADIAVSFENISSASQNLNSVFWVQEKLNHPTAGGNFLLPAGLYDPYQWNTLVTQFNSDQDRQDLHKTCKAGQSALKQEVFRSVNRQMVDFAGFDSRYFIKIFKPLAPSVDARAERSQLATTDGCLISFVFSLDQGLIKPQEKASFNFEAYFGPKDIDVLRQYAPNMEDSVNLGWIGFIAKPLLRSLKLIYSFVGNYGLAIIIITLLLKILFYPLTKQAAVSAHQMKKIQPYLKEMQEKYKDDRQKMQLELIRLYKEHKINPAKSCLPILPTIPVFLAFYQVLMYAIDLRQAPFYFWINDLSQKDPTFVTPILLGGLMLLQMKMTPTVGMDKTQQNIMMMMPIIFTFAMITLPSGLVVYMIANTIFTILQQKIINSKLDKGTAK